MYFFFFLQKEILNCHVLCWLWTKPGFETIKCNIPAPGTSFVMNFCLIQLLLLLTTEGYTDLHLMPSSKLFHCSVFLFNLVNSSSFSLLFSYSFGWALCRNVENRTLLILFSPFQSDGYLKAIHFDEKQGCF